MAVIMRFDLFYRLTSSNTFLREWMFS